MPDKINYKSIEKLKAEILYWLCTGFIYSMLFWTLLNSIFAILISAFWLFFLKKKFDFSGYRSKMVVLFVSIYIIGIIGLLYTNNMTKGIAILQKQSALLFFPLVFGTTSVLSSLSVKRLMTHFLIATGSTCIIGLGIGAYNFYISGNIETITGTGILVFYNFTTFLMGLYCLTALIFIFNSSKVDFEKFKKWLILLTLVLSVFIFLLSLRIIIFCWLLLLLFFAWNNIKRKLHRVLLAFGLLSATIMSGILITPLKNQWRELVDLSGKGNIVLDADSSLGHNWGGKALRVAIWKCSADVIRKHWLTGVGTGDTQDSLQQAYENRKFYFASRYNQYHAHNQYLQFAIGFGMPGLLLMVFCISVPLYQYRRKYSNNVYWLFLAIFAFTALTESVLELNKGIILYSFFNSIFAFTSLKNTG
jgi:O-antigen ligase